MADDRIRELEINIRVIDIETILARRREGRQEQVTEGEEEGDKFGQENGSTEGSCLVNMILCYMN